MTVPARNARDDGFTLLELIVVVTLISIMFFFAVPRFAETAFTDDVFRTTRWVVQQSHALREAAMETGSDRFLVIDVDNRRLRVTTTIADEVNAGTEAVGKSYQLPHQQAITGVTFADGSKISSGSAHIRFSKIGTATGAVIELSVGSGAPVTMEIETFLPEVRVQRNALR